MEFHGLLRDWLNGFSYFGLIFLVFFFSVGRFPIHYSFSFIYSSLAGAFWVKFTKSPSLWDGELSVCCSNTNRLRLLPQQTMNFEWNSLETKQSTTHFPASSTTVANINSVDLSLTMTWQSSTSGDAAFSSSSSFEPDAVFVGASSGSIREPVLLLSNVVSASLRVCARFSITLPPVVKSAMFGLRAALCFLARIRRACGMMGFSWWMFDNNKNNKCIDGGSGIRMGVDFQRGRGSGVWGVRNTIQEDTICHTTIQISPPPAPPNPLHDWSTAIQLSSDYHCFYWMLLSRDSSQSSIYIW